MLAAGIAIVLPVSVKPLRQVVSRKPIFARIPHRRPDRRPDRRPRRRTRHGRMLAANVARGMLFPILLSPEWGGVRNREQERIIGAVGCQQVGQERAARQIAHAILQPVRQARPAPSPPLCAAVRRAANASPFPGLCPLPLSLVCVPGVLFGFFAAFRFGPPVAFVWVATVREWPQTRREDMRTRESSSGASYSKRLENQVAQIVGRVIFDRYLDIVKSAPPPSRSPAARAEDAGPDQFGANTTLHPIPFSVPYGGRRRSLPTSSHLHAAL